MKGDRQRLGGLARANKLTPERRSEIAQKAAATRWADPKPTQRKPTQRQMELEIARATADAAAVTYRYWEDRVETARMIMAAAIMEFEECRARLRQAEQDCRRLAEMGWRRWGK